MIERVFGFCVIIFEELVNKLKTTLRAIPPAKSLPNFWKPILDPELIQHIQYDQVNRIECNAMLVISCSTC